MTLDRKNSTRVRACAALLVAFAPAFVASCSSSDGGAESKPVAISMRVSNELLEQPLLDVAGRPHVLASGLRSGRPAALVFWQTWCASCVAEAPALAAAARANPGIDFYGVVSGPTGKVDDVKVVVVAAELGLPYPNLRDTALDLTRELEIQGTPTIVVLSPAGEVVFNEHSPPEDWSVFTR